MYSIRVTRLFAKDLKRVKKRGYDITLLEEVLNILASGEVLPDKYRDHQLTGNLREFRECHIKPDWLLIYQIHKDELILFLTRTGTHSDLFNK